MKTQAGEVLSFRSQNKTIVWHSTSNRWAIFEEPAWYVFKLFHKKKEFNKIAEAFKHRYELRVEDAETFVRDAINLFNEFIVGKAERSLHEIEINRGSSNIVEKSKYTHQYTFKQLVFRIYSEQGWVEDSIHPLFKHLESSQLDNNDEVQFYVSKVSGVYHLFSQSNKLKAWQFNENQFVKGRLFIELLNKLYRKTEDDWMFFLHGSAITNGKNTVVITAPSGGGKSTLTAFLVASGFKFVSDDVVAIDRESGLAYPFPAALSVKEDAVPHLVSSFPELEVAEGYGSCGSAKRWRYLPIVNDYSLDFLTQPVTAIVNVEYSLSVEFDFRKLEQIQAIQLINQESWIPPKVKNVKQYFKWVTRLPIYKLTYSNTEKAVESIRSLF